jgi:hypothetical protein
MSLADARLELFPLLAPGPEASIEPEGRAN